MSANSKILVIDDEQLVTKFLESRLTRDGMEVEIISNGLEAVHKVNQEKYDLIISDLMVPQVSGPEMIMHFKNSQINSKTPIIVLSSLSTDEVIVDILSLGVNDYLVKPFSINVMMAKVKQQLGPIAA